MTDDRQYVEFFQDGLTNKQTNIDKNNSFFHQKVGIEIFYVWVMFEVMFLLLFEHMPSCKQYVNPVKPLTMIRAIQTAVSKRVVFFSMVYVICKKERCFFLRAKAKLFVFYVWMFTNVIQRGISIRRKCDFVRAKAKLFVFNVWMFTNVIQRGISRNNKWFVGYIGKFEV